MTKWGGISTSLLFVLVLAYQLFQVFLWPTVWKESRYYKNCVPTGKPGSEPCTVDATALALLIVEFVLGLCALLFLFVDTPVNGYPIRMHSLRNDKGVDDNELYLMTSSSR